MITPTTLSVPTSASKPRLIMYHNGKWGCGFSRLFDNGMRVWDTFECGFGDTPEEAWGDYCIKTNKLGMGRFNRMYNDLRETHAPSSFLESLMFWRKK